jgi:ubiquinone biosynthesis accessory factor UbiJ
MAATPAWLAAVEALLNRGVHASMQATALARRLAGTALLLDIEGMASIRISVVGERLSLIGAGALDSPADATIVGSPLALLRLAGATGLGGTTGFGGATGLGGTTGFGGATGLGGTTGFGGATGFGGTTGGAAVGGDPEIANSYRELLVLARPDFEEELSRLMGDVPARPLSQFALKTVEWVRRARRTAGENIAEYLQEESRDLVNKPELDEFLQGVDTLRETADRVGARIARLEQRLKGSA